MSSAPPTHQLFEALVEPCRRPLWTFLLRLVGERAAAEDLLQETLLRAWRALPSYREEGRFSSWLFRIAHNVVRDDRRRRQTRPALVAVEVPPDLADSRTSDARALAREARGRLNTALSKLSEDQRTVFLLRMHSDFSFRAIAELTEAPLSTVINRMRDALGKLESAMEKEA